MPAGARRDALAGGDRLPDLSHVALWQPRRSDGRQECGVDRRGPVVHRQTLRCPEGHVGTHASRIPDTTSREMPILTHAYTGRCIEDGADHRRATVE